MNIFDIVIIVLVATAFGFALYKLIKGKKSSCCSGGCESCDKCIKCDIGQKNV